MALPQGADHVLVHVVAAVVVLEHEGRAVGLGDVARGRADEAGDVVQRARGGEVLHDLHETAFGVAGFHGPFIVTQGGQALKNQELNRAAPPGRLGSGKHRARMAELLLLPLTLYRLVSIVSASDLRRRVGLRQLEVGLAARTYPSQKGKILEAAEKLVLARGIGNFKTDVLIEASGLSKGGFFYHFKSIDDLLFELGKKTTDGFYGEIEKVASKDANPVGRHIRAYIKVALLGSPSQRKRALAMSRIFFEVLLANPKVMSRLKRENSKAHRVLEDVFMNDQLPPLQIYLIQSAADGVWVNESLGITEISKKSKEALCNLLIAMTERPLNELLGTKSTSR
ncbi:TetR/AcrR family transcriptional regulator [Polyangium sorediatum]|uniref:TetR/AcrR family transcriptional regulator n=1 Tax=Polyangium sorediatum TaxID=889274 RepID=A0ABT6PBP1_9BACT|nr:TetR/AcrR family transcriptional regulator [Polyangium sorediatum]MDI1437687.1 TetR/AcrR family transcriptional regulator [Polyangium sorediatum]